MVDVTAQDIGETAMERALKIFVSWYVVIAAVFIFYANFDYLKRSSFSDWLLLGEVSATAKGIVWPYFLYERYQRENEVVLSDKVSRIHKKNISSYRIISSDETVSKNDLIELIVRTWKISQPMKEFEEMCIKNVLNGKFLTRELKLIVNYSNSAEKQTARKALAGRSADFAKCFAGGEKKGG